MKSQAQRAAKRKKREDRPEKSEGWMCAGCKIRHPFGQSCPAPRLYARGFNRSRA